MGWQQLLTGTFLITLLASGVRLGLPLLLAGLGETFAERSGILNIGIEGMMLVGALGGFLGSYLTGSPWVGLACGVLAGALASLVHALLSVTLAADQVVSGLVVNILGVGVAVFVFRAVFGILTYMPQAAGFDVWPIPVLGDLPVLGPILFRHNALVYLGLLLVPVTYVVLFYTTFGLRVTAVGEDPHAAETMGISPRRVRYAAVLLGGTLAGMAGTSLSLGQLSTFQETIVAGRGFIAIAVVMLGRWRPVGVLGAALLFGLVDAFQLQLQAFSISSIPPQLLAGLPYLVTILAVLTSAGKASIPSAMCIPYMKEG